MSTLFRKVWESVSTRSSSHSNSNSSANSIDQFEQMMMYIQTASTGEFDRIPLDIFIQILKILGPKESAKMSVVCKSWKFIVSDNRLWIHFLQNQHDAWDSTFFAETHLRSGPLRTFPNSVPDLSFMSIYGQRAQVPGAIIIDDTESDKAARGQLKDAIHSTLFDMNVPAVCAVNQAVLALFAAKKVSGIVVNIGFHQTSIVPILHGKVMHQVGVEVVGIGALKLTGFLKEKMQQKNIYFGSLYTVRALKENLCYVALDYEAELSKDTNASFQVVSEGWFTLSEERFKTGEILFQPRIAGMRAMGLHNAVALCMEHCQDAELMADDSWYKTVVLAGGSACLPGLAERLEKEVCGLLPPCMSNGIRVLPPPRGVDSAWFGAKLIGNVDIDADP
ncbi:hypothetical protein RND71_024089 [Anisodus tanguticus]|uniref:F-box domain-containing protein n=1 Tax=Anisodus tanguticus TaxID=243964 RepID=A0AAE1V3M6_9SOLA|nr:hypothetical protein RND71_024089 [Anisodus tanguticus]